MLLTVPAFPGLRRIFNNGEVPDYAWDKGGRYYSLPGGHYYETWSADKRRSAIKINGEAVEEADLRASHLTLLHALMGWRFDAHVEPACRAPVHALCAADRRRQQWRYITAEDGGADGCIKKLADPVVAHRADRRERQ